jgi:hypothetical protein
VIIEGERDLKETIKIVVLEEAGIEFLFLIHLDEHEED